jgi:hypothetical protein
MTRRLKTHNLHKILCVVHRLMQDAVPPSPSVHVSNSRNTATILFPLQQVKTEKQNEVRYSDQRIGTLCHSSFGSGQASEHSGRHSR